MSVIVAGLAVAVVVVGPRVWTAWEDAGNRRDALDAARQAVTALTTLSHQDVDGTVARLLAVSTGEFAAELRGASAPFTDTVRQERAQSTGTIVEAGVESDTGDTIGVLVAVNAQVRNAASPVAGGREYRLRATVQRVHGRWLLAGLDFVP